MHGDHIIYDAHGCLVTPDLVLRAYQSRCFPMADHREGVINWYRPVMRAVVTWDRFRIPRSLQKTWQRTALTVTCDTAFDQVIDRCAARDETWISRDLQRLYQELHERGRAHSVEAWDADGRLVGGLYGLAIGGVFCGESMFHTVPDASKYCVIVLVESLRRSGFGLLDCQQQTPHMERFGARLISDADYEALLLDHLEQRVF